MNTSTITPHNFAGIQPFMTSWDYLDNVFERHSIDKRCTVLDANFAALRDEDAKNIANHIKGTLGQQETCMIFTQIQTENGLHMIAIGIEQSDDHQVQMTFMDPAGDRMKQDIVPSLAKIIEAADLTGLVNLITEIPTQQFPDQPNTCALWAAKNGVEFLTEGAITVPANAADAADDIMPELQGYLSFQENRRQAQQQAKAKLALSDLA